MLLISRTIKTENNMTTENQNEKEMLLVSSKTKEALKSTGLNVSGEALEKLNERVYAIVKDAQDRCVANGRKTVKASDI